MKDVVIVSAVRTAIGTFGGSLKDVPAAAVIRRWQALSGFIGRKASAGGFLSLM